MSDQRKIYHIDLDAFFCAVEEIDHLELRGKAFAVGGLPSHRGVVASCSYPARRFGVHSAMPMGKAKNLCPQLIIVPPHYARYKQLSTEVFNLIRSFSDIVEQVSIDEAFVDLSSSDKKADELAHEIQQLINTRLDLPCSIGVASNKLLAKIANDFGKSISKRNAPPNAITIVPTGQEKSFLEPLRTQALWGVGVKTAHRLSELGINTIGELAVFPKADLINYFGKFGAVLADRAQGLDDVPVTTEHEIKSISQEITFNQDTKDEKILRSTIMNLSQKVARKLVANHMYCSNVKIKIRWSNFQTITRQTTLVASTEREEIIYNTALILLSQTWRGQLVRLIGVGVGGLSSNSLQLSLWDDYP